METTKPEAKTNKGSVVGCLVFIIIVALFFVSMVADSIADINADNEFIADCQDYAESTANLSGEVVFGSSRTRPDLCRILKADGQVFEYTRQELSVLLGS